MAELNGLPERYEKMSLEELHEEISRMEQLLRLLKKKVEVSEPGLSCCKTVDVGVHSTQDTGMGTVPRSGKTKALREPGSVRALKTQEYKRYGRQMIMPEIGLSGMVKSA